LLSDAKHFKNRAERVEFIKDLVKPGAPGGNSDQVKLMNRNTKPPKTDATTEDANSKAESQKATKIMNRARELQGQHKNLSDATAVTMAQREIENAS
jgi:hypothetical protein